MQKCKNAKMQILQCYRAISCRIVRYRTSRKKNVVSLHREWDRNCNTLQYPVEPCNIVQYPAIPCIAPKSCRTFAPELRRGLTQRNRARSADEHRSMTLARVLAAPRQSSSKLGSTLGLHNTCHCDINVDGGSNKSGQQQSFPTYPTKVGYHITSVLWLNDTNIASLQKAAVILSRPGCKFY